MRTPRSLDHFVEILPRARLAPATKALFQFHVLLTFEERQALSWLARNLHKTRSDIVRELVLAEFNAQTGSGEHSKRRAAP
jgi:hypothetical protein